MTDILAIDLGTKFGWAYLDYTGLESGHGSYIDITDWGKQFKALLELWKPDIVVLSQTNQFGNWNATRKMLMQAGVAFYICGKAGIQGVEFGDKQARKYALGYGGNKIKAHAAFDELMPECKEFTGDQKDAVILALGWNKYTNQKN